MVSLLVFEHVLCETSIIICFGVFFSCSAGIALPVYFSFKAIEKDDPNEQRR